MDFVRQKFTEGTNFLRRRYEGGNILLTIDIIRLMFILGLIVSIYLDTWADYIGLVYPILESIKAIITPGAQDDTFWIKYWFIFGLIKMIFDHFFPFLKDMIPGFSFIRAGFLSYCFSRRYQGATFVYAAISPHILGVVAAFEGFLHRILTD